MTERWAIARLIIMGFSFRTGMLPHMQSDYLSFLGLS